MDILKRFTNPSKHVLEPYGTVCQNEDQYFIQVSKDPEIANWITLGELLEIVHRESILRDDFLLQCLNAYESKKV